jgi:hypothetical protein
VFDHLFRVLFLIDIVVTFNTEITGPKGNTVTDRREIARNYVRGWFVFDVIACIPFREMWRADVEYLCRMLRVLKLPKTVNLIDGRGFSLLFTILRSEGSRDENIYFSFVLRYIGSLLQMVVVLLLLVYGFGCFWYWYVGMVEDEEYSRVEFITSYNLDHEDIVRRVLVSLYFMMTTLTTVGYGDYLAKNVSEYAMICIIMLIGTGVFAYVMGSVNSLIEDY